MVAENVQRARYEYNHADRICPGCMSITKVLPFFRTSQLSRRKLNTKDLKKLIILIIKIEITTGKNAKSTDKTDIVVSKKNNQTIKVFEIFRNRYFKLTST